MVEEQLLELEVVIKPVLVVQEVDCLLLLGQTDNLVVHLDIIQVVVEVEVQLIDLKLVLPVQVD